MQNVPEGIAAYKEMMTGKTAFNNNPKKALAAIGIVSVIPIFSGLIGLVYLQGRICYFNDPSVICWRNILCSIMT
jgi:hypothetical protein